MALPWSVDINSNTSDGTTFTFYLISDECLWWDKYATGNFQVEHTSGILPDLQTTSDLIMKENKMPTNWWGRQNAAGLKFDPKPSEAAFLAVFFNFGKY